jgi:hypothetical protein
LRYSDSVRIMLTKAQGSYSSASIEDDQKQVVRVGARDQMQTFRK